MWLNHRISDKAEAAETNPHRSGTEMVTFMGLAKCQNFLLSLPNPILGRAIDGCFPISKKSTHHFP